MKLYGIPNCDTVRKARAYLDDCGIAYEFHDFRKHGVTGNMISGWLQQVGWQKLLKKTGPTWGRLPGAVKASIDNDASAFKLMLEQPNVIKRPVLENDGKVLATGFDETAYSQIFKK